MMIQVNDTTCQVAYGSAYTYIDMTCEKHSALIGIVRGRRNYIHVVVKNASNRTWRGAGKEFDTITDALANYKTASIRAMIEHAHQIAGDRRATSSAACG